MLFTQQLDCQQRSCAASLLADGIALCTRTYAARLQSCLRDEEIDADGLAHVRDLRSPAVCLAPQPTMDLPWDH